MPPILAPPKGESDFIAAAMKPKEPRLPLVKELLYRKKLTYFAADPGIGKTTLAEQLCLSLACCKPAFGIFDVPEPAICYYMGQETEWAEFQETLETMGSDPSLQWNHKGIYFDEELIMKDVLAEKDLQEIEKRVLACKPSLIVVDPLFLFVGGDLKDGKVASRATRWMRSLAQKANAAVLALHHTHRPPRDNKGKEVEEKDRSYGSRFLLAGATLWWQLDEHADGVHFYKIKDRFKLSRKEFYLYYNPENGLSTGGQLESKPLGDRLYEWWLGSRPGTRFLYSEMSERLECAEGYLFELLKDGRLNALVKRERDENKRVVFVRNNFKWNGSAAPAAPTVDTSAMDNHSTGAHK